MSHQHINESLSMEWDLETWVINSTFTASVVYPTLVADSIFHCLSNPAWGCDFRHCTHYTHSCRGVM